MKDTNRDAKGRFVKGNNANPNGRPKDGQSWSAIISEIGNMYPEDILEFIPKNNDLGRTVAQLPKSVQMKYLVIMRIYAALLFEPASGLLKEFLDRMEGKVETPIKHSGEMSMTWKEFVSGSGSDPDTDSE